MYHALTVIAIGLYYLDCTDFTEDKRHLNMMTSLNSNSIQNVMNDYGYGH